MNNIWVFPAASSTSSSPFWGLYSYFSNQISFEFYNDAACTQPSSGQTGVFTVNGKGSSNSVYQSIPAGSINISSPTSLGWSGVANQLQVQVTTPLANTNYVRIVFFRE